MRTRSYALLAAGLLLVACSGPGPDASIPVPEKNRDQWVLPLDKYLEPSNAGVYRVAWLHQMGACLQEGGISVPEVPADFTDDHDPVFNAAGHRLFDPTIAGTYGYHLESDLPIARPLDVGDYFSEHFESWGESGQRTFDACAKTYDRLLGTTSDSALASGLASSSSSTAAEDPAVKSAAGAWATCMKPLGIADLPATPADFPSESVLSRLGIEQTGDSGSLNSYPTPEEIDLATTDAGCRESSGYSQKLYDAQWDAQLPLLQENHAGLESRLASTEKLRTECEGIVNG